MENEHALPVERRWPGIGAKIACVGIVAGVILRVVEMLFFFDYDAGFSTDNGLLSWISVGVACTAALIGCLLSFKTESLGEYGPRRNVSLGCAGILSGVMLLVSGALQSADYARFLRTGVSSYDASERGVIHVIFFCMCFLFGVFQLIIGAGCFAGKDPFAKAPLLHLVGVLWGVSYLLLVYVFYAKSPSLTENIFAVAGGACVLLGLFYQAELVIGMNSVRAAKRMYVFGLFAVTLTITYTFSNLMLRLLGKNYVGEIHPIIQLACLGAALFLLVFLMTFRPVSVESGRRFRKD